jgi:putative acetyltransferase
MRQPPTLRQFAGEPRYYNRFGFRPDPDLKLPGVPPEYFQAIAFDDSQPRGDISYHAAFNASS